LPAFCSELKGEIVEIEYYSIKNKEGEIQINKVICENKDETDKVYKAIVALHNIEISCFKKDAEVFEFISNNSELIKNKRNIQYDRKSGWS
jgi:hypothetical protein